MSSETTPFLLAYITDAAWREISGRFNLPDEARSRIDEAQYFYRSWQQAEGLKSPSDTKVDLQRLANTFDRAIELVAQLRSNPRSLVTLAIAIGGSDASSIDPHLASETIKNWVDHIDQIRTTIKNAESAVASGPKGAWERGFVLRLLVQLLDNILFDFAEQRIDRSGKGQANARDYITAVCNVIDPEIGSGSIEEAMKIVIAARRRNEPEKPS